MLVCTNDIEIKVRCCDMSGGMEMRTKCVNNSLVDREKWIWCHFVFKIGKS